MNIQLVIQREKNNVVYIRTIPNDAKLPEPSYTSLPLNEMWYLKFMSISGWEPINTEHTFEFRNVFNNDIKTLFFELAKTFNIKSSIVYTKSVESNVEGTSCLIRNSTKTEIKIGRRKEGSSKNVTVINRVCINDAIRNEFFRDVRNLPRFMMDNKYLINYKDSSFDKWNTYMTEEYIRQTNQQGKH